MGKIKDKLDRIIERAIRISKEEILDKKGKNR